ncbi:MAG: hypothetical protein LBP83_00870 [Dysgonamonadaceae bacterium]|nr:hypothetical protein [Dysgonamonadaceae bacterium]
MIQSNKKYKGGKLWFICLLFLSAAMHAQTQTPGGTSLNVKLWLAADKLNGTSPLQNNLTNVNPWKDLSGKGMDFIQNGNNELPQLTYSGMNFHPSVEFLRGSNATADQTKKLVSNQYFTTSADSAYYTFWVSTFSSGGVAGTYASVFTFGGNADLNRNENGWRITGPAIYHTTRNSANRHHNDLSKNYGIGSIFRPNSSNANSEYQYHNGDSAAFTGTTISNMTTFNAIIGNSNTTNSDYFYGQVQEIIVLSVPKTSGLDAGELKKVHSYLAIKYGQTMENFPDFVNSSGTNVWTGTNNTGYTSHIFGIGRDDASGLYQKQSANYEFQDLTVFVGDNITAINSQNTGNLDNGTCLMLGSNGSSTGRTPYSYGAGTVFANGTTLNNPITERFNLAYKAQLTGTNSMEVNMRMHRTRPQYILVSDNPAFPAASTRIYSVDKENDIARNVVINPGDYIGFACHPTSGPGGVTDGLKMWLRADYDATLNIDGNGDVSEWRDVNRDDFKYEYLNAGTGNTKPRYELNHPKMNFHPSLHFPSVGAFLSSTTGLMSVAAPDALSFISLVNVTEYGAVVDGVTATHFMGFGNTYPGTGTGLMSARRPSFGIGVENDAGTGRFIHYQTKSESVNGVKRLFSRGATTLTLHQISKSGTNDFNIEFEIGANNETFTNQTAPDNYSAMILNESSMLGTGSASNRNLLGYMSEMIAYERILTAEEKNKIYSYLGMKYGVTLDPEPGNLALNYDYVLSDNTSVWQGTSSPLHRVYHHNVAMVVRDDAADLMNKQARSTDTGDFIVMGVNGTVLSLDGNVDMAGFTSDLSAIAWGNNGEPYDATAATKVDISGLSHVCGNMDYRAKRIWMIDKTASGDQKIMIGVGGEYFHESGANYQVFLLFGDSEDLENNEWSQVVPTNYYNDLHQGLYTLTDDLTYFTIGVKELPGSCETCQFSNYKNLYFTSSNWPNGTTSKTFDLGEGFSAQVNVALATGSNFYSGYPQASSNTLREYRRLNLDREMTTTISHYATGTSTSYPVAASFQIYEIDREGNALDEVDIIGYCGNSEVYPILSYVAAANASSYTIVNTHHVSAKHQPTPAYADNAGKLNVLFDYPVEKIIIKHNAIGTGTASGSQRIGIGPIQFFCTPPIPEPNEDGLVLTKLATPSSNVSLCDNVSYTFQLYNTNCVAMDVNFSDVLPTGMKWHAESLQISDTLAANYQVNAYADQKVLSITGLTIHPASSTRISASAFFDENATASTTYSNQSSIEYKNFSGFDKSLLSCDRYITGGCAPTSVVTSSVTTRTLPVELMHETNKSVYGAKDNITIRVRINNPNNSIAGVVLNISYNEAFTYNTSSPLRSSPNINGIVTLNSEPGILNVTGITLPDNTEGWFEFDLKAPEKDNLEKVFNENGDMVDVDGNVVTDPKLQAIFPLLVGYSFTATTSDKCMEMTFLNASGEIQIPYNIASKAYIISNKHVTGIPKR